MPGFDEWASLLTALRNPMVGNAREQLVLRTLALSRDVAEATVGCSLTEIDVSHSGRV